MAAKAPMARAGSGLLATSCPLELWPQDARGRPAHELSVEAHQLLRPPADDELDRLAGSSGKAP